MIPRRLFSEWTRRCPARSMRSRADGAMNASSFKRILVEAPAKDKWGSFNHFDT